jgi:AraC-like DNA-binding protein
MPTTKRGDMEDDSKQVPGSSGLWDSSLSYITRSATIQEHRHYCYKVAVSLDHMVNCWVSQSPHIGIRGFIVNQQKHHQCASPGGPVLNVLIEPESSWGSRIKKLLSGRDFIRFEQIIDPDSLGPVLPVEYNSLPNEALMGHIQRLIDVVTGSSADEIKAIDGRIERLLLFLKENLTGRISRTQIQDITFLSFDRARHLFTKEVGISLSRYILWQRLRCALKDIVTGGASLTEITKNYAFTDLSHFNRTFKQMFGFSPSAFLLESRLII